MNSKVIIDPQSQEESSLTNNLVLVTNYFPMKLYFESKSQRGGEAKPLNLNKIASITDKGSNFLRCSYEGCQAQSMVQLEFQSSTLSIKELKDISGYVKSKVAATGPEARKNQ